MMEQLTIAAGHFSFSLLILEALLVSTGLFLVFIMHNFLLRVNKVSISSSNQGPRLPPSFSPTQERYFKRFCCPLSLPRLLPFAKII